MKKLSGTLMIQILAREPETGFEPRAKKSASCIKLKVKKFLRRQKIVQFTKCESVQVLSKSFRVIFLPDGPVDSQVKKRLSILSIPL